MIKALAAKSAGGNLEPFEYDPGALQPEQVEIDVLACGLCHSDLAMLNNDWQISAYPLVPGHEVVGRVSAAGPQVRRVKVGDMVGLGWFSQSCMSCTECLDGNHNLCTTAEQTIVGRHGGFASKVRCHWSWATPIPEGIDPLKAGPLFCGGITVFNPILQLGILPTERVGVIGIGGLGHLALQFLDKWGCHVTAFTTSDAKAAEAKSLGADAVVNSRSDDEIAKIAGSLDAIIVTANADLNWDAYIGTLAPRGRLHFVGVVPSPVASYVFPLIVGQKSISGTPVGSPSNTLRMIEFAARHGIAPVTEHFKMSQANDALEHLRTGKARYRIVLENDIA
jgi:uncharacterized zinc-type alcohol dehydrogenase-like protein